MTWTVGLDPISSGEKCKIELENNLDLIVLEDILFGDVWFCSGQSNMGWSMKGTHFSPSKTIKSRLFSKAILDFLPELMGSKLIVHVISFSSYRKIENKIIKHSTHHLFVIICFSTIFSINDE